MRTVFLAISVVALLAGSARAEQPRSPKTDKAADTVRQLPLKGAGGGNSCAAYGPGFVKVEGTGTCIRTGGATSVGVGGTR
jgi:hypothetical protein